MSFEKLKVVLDKCHILKNIEFFEFETIPHGEVSPHVYKVSKGTLSYFVKMVKDNEKAILKTLIAVTSDIIPRVICPDLLNKNVLVQEYISGGHPKSKKIESQLVIKYVQLQNKLNEPEHQNVLNEYNGCKYPDKDDGLFSKWIDGDFDADQDLLKLKKLYGLKIIDKYMDILSHIKKERSNIVRDYSSMPFAILHNDFKENNIIGKPQKLIDWGSFYSYGPFLKDIAKFLIKDEDNLSVFTKHSNICRISSSNDINRWLYVSLCANFLGLLKWRLVVGGNFNNREECNRFLEYEYATYNRLLEI
jgi:hypothetical protein